MNSTNSISRQVGVELKQLREKAGLTAFQLANLSGMKSEQQIYRYERGVNKIGIDELVAALKVLNFDVGAFFELVIKKSLMANELVDTDKESSIAYELVDTDKESSIANELVDTDKKKHCLETLTAVNPSLSRILVSMLIK